MNYRMMLTSFSDGPAFNLLLNNDKDITFDINGQIDWYHADKYLTDKGLLLDTIEYSKQFDSTDLEALPTIKKDINEKDDIIDMVMLMFNENEDVDVLKILDDNPILRTKKVVLSNETLSIGDFDRLHELIKKYDKYKYNIYVHQEGNDLPVCLMDAYMPMATVFNKIEDIQYKGLSPLETIMYVYDLVRKRVYTHEDESTEHYTVSRDLNSVLFGDKIVCAGYAVIFQTILSNLGIKTYPLNITSPTSAHQRNIIHVVDPKYNVDGVYLFDATWDSKDNYDNDDYLYSYRFFARTLDYMDGIEGHHFTYEVCTDVDNIVPNLEKDLEKMIPTDLYTNYLKQLNKMADYADVKRPFDLFNNDFVGIMTGKIKINKEDMIPKVKNLVSLYNKPIDAATFIELVNNVRKVEYEENKELYKYNIDVLYNVYKRSDWDFDTGYLLKSLIFSANYKTKDPSDIAFLYYMDDTSLNKRVKKAKEEIDGKEKKKTL